MFGRVQPRSKLPLPTRSRLTSFVLEGRPTDGRTTLRCALREVGNVEFEGGAEWFYRLESVYRQSPIFETGAVDL